MAMLVGAVGIILEPNNQAEMVVLNMVQSLSLAAVLNLNINADICESCTV